MTELSVASRNAISAMLEAAPDSALGKLSVALRSTPGAKADWIRKRTVAEINARRMRAIAFGPLIALFRKRADGVRGMNFPSPILNGLWRAVSARQPLLLEQAEDMTVGGGEISPRLLDQLCLSAAAVLRDEPGAIWPGLDARTAQNLAACFDLAPMARAAMPMLDLWTGRPDADSAASLRLMMRDTTRISEDAAPRMLEILFANIREAPLILRVISRVSGVSGEERFLAESELADFGERLFEQVEETADDLDQFHPARNVPEEARVIADRLTRASDLMAQMELSLAFTHEGAWGARFHVLKQRMGRALENLMGLCPRMVDKALPMERVRIHGAMSRMAPVMDARTDGPLVQQARAAMTVLGMSKAAANVLGCAGQRTQVCETLEKRLSQYGDELIEALNAGEGPDESQMTALAVLCAEFLVQADAEVPARTLRRRLAAATGATAAPSPQIA
ncbi:MAG: hypothetical protein ACK4FB_04710 [Brevundimonas sp.]|uniref:hypothetical protein n=1 Tax=Brevundimonas sp. TaxID=1871086 RepID=UPI00391B8F4B